MNPDREDMVDWEHASHEQQRRTSVLDVSAAVLENTERSMSYHQPPRWVPQNLFRASSDKSAGDNGPTGFKSELVKHSWSSMKFADMQKQHPRTLRRGLSSHLTWQKNVCFRFISLTNSFIIAFQITTQKAGQGEHNIRLAILDTRTTRQDAIIFRVDRLIDELDLNDTFPKWHLKRFNTEYLAIGDGHRRHTPGQLQDAHQEGHL